MHGNLTRAAHVHERTYLSGLLHLPKRLWCCSAGCCCRSGTVAALEVSLHLLVFCYQFTGASASDVSFHIAVRYRTSTLSYHCTCVHFTITLLLQHSNLNSIPALPMVSGAEPQPCHITALACVLLSPSCCSTAISARPMAPCCRASTYQSGSSCQSFSSFCPLQLPA